MAKGGQGQSSLRTVLRNDGTGRAQKTGFPLPWMYESWVCGCCAPVFSEKRGCGASRWREPMAESEASVAMPSVVELEDVNISSLNRPGPDATALVRAKAQGVSWPPPRLPCGSWRPFTAKERLTSSCSFPVRPWEYHSPLSRTFGAAAGASDLPWGVNTSWNELKTAMSTAS
jgi:hypothetical protein